MPNVYQSTGARFSKDGRFRSLLWRVWNVNRPHILFVMLNPSTADAQQDDRTIQKCVRFARCNGCGSMAAVNLFAFRSTNPQRLKDEHRNGNDIIGAENDDTIIQAAVSSQIIVLAWGADGRFLGRDEEVHKLLQAYPLYCLGRTADGQPRHPLYLANATPLVPYNAFTL